MTSPEAGFKKPKEKPQSNSDILGKNTLTHDPRPQGQPEGGLENKGNRRNLMFGIGAAASGIAIALGSFLAGGKGEAKTETPVPTTVPTAEAPVTPGTDAAPTTAPEVTTTPEAEPSVERPAPREWAGINEFREKVKDSAAWEALDHPTKVQIVSEFFAQNYEGYEPGQVHFMDKDQFLNYGALMRLDAIFAIGIEQEDGDWLAQCLLDGSVMNSEGGQQVKEEVMAYIDYIKGLSSPVDYPVMIDFFKPENIHILKQSEYSRQSLELRKEDGTIARYMGMVTSFVGNNYLEFGNVWNNTKTVAVAEDQTTNEPLMYQYFGGATSLSKIQFDVEGPLIDTAMVADEWAAWYEKNGGNVKNK